MLHLLQSIVTGWDCFHTHKYILKKTNVWLNVIKLSSMKMDLNLRRRAANVQEIQHVLVGDDSDVD